MTDNANFAVLPSDEHSYVHSWAAKGDTYKAIDTLLSTLRMQCSCHRSIANKVKLAADQGIVLNHKLLFTEMNELIELMEDTIRAPVVQNLKRILDDPETTDFAAYKRSKFIKLNLENPRRERSAEEKAADLYHKQETSKKRWDRELRGLVGENHIGASAVSTFLGL